MKRTPLIILILSLLLTSGLVLSQAATENSYLKIGDKPPHLSALKWMKGNPVTEFEKGRIYVLEFGATWCAPCAALIPELTALANEYRENTTIVGFFVMEYKGKSNDPGNLDYVSRVEKYIRKQGDKMQYNLATDDPQGTMETNWLKAAGKTGIPYTFVIDKAGRIAWIGSNPQELRKVLQWVNSNDYNLDGFIEGSKRKVTQLQQNLLLFTSIDSSKDVLYSSLISKYREGQEGLPNNPFIDNWRWALPGSEPAKHQGNVQAVGESLRRLYYMAYADTLWNYPLMMNPATGIYPDTIEYPSQRRSYGKYWYRPLLEIKDSSLFESTYITPENRFNYFLKAPLEKATSKILQQAMQRDLQIYFGYKVEVEHRMMPCWYLTISDKTKPTLKSKNPQAPYKMYEDDKGNYHFENGEIRDIIFQLEIKYGYGSLGALTHHPLKQPPFVDIT